MPTFAPRLPLFAYGTLCDPELLAAVLGRGLVPGQQLPATAPGYAAVHYPDRIYPALVRQPGAIAEGVLLTGLSPFEHDLLDAFEGEEYRRAVVPVIVDLELHEAEAFLPAVAVAATAKPWTLQGWQAVHKPRVLAAEALTAEQLRQKLIAVRPN